MVTSEALTSQRGPSREGSGLTDVMQSSLVRQSSDKQPGAVHFLHLPGQSRAWKGYKGD